MFVTPTRNTTSPSRHPSQQGADPDLDRQLLTFVVCTQAKGKLNDLCSADIDFFGTFDKRIGSPDLAKRRKQVSNRYAKLAFLYNHDRSQFLDLCRTNQVDLHGAFAAIDTNETMALFSTSHTNIVKTDEFELNLINPMRNPYGIWSFRTKMCPVPNTTDLFYDTVDLVVNIPDYFDYLEFESILYKGKLIENGRAITMEVPAHPLWMQKTEVLKEIHKKPSKRHKDAHNKTRDTHLVIASRVRAVRKLHTIKLIMRFPDGIQCNNDFWNPNKAANDSHSLHRETDVIAISKQVNFRGVLRLLEENKSCCSFKMPIIGTEDTTTVDSPRHGEEGLEALEGMAHIQI